mmetsp:Transcript_25211/g.40466  ORF Transcript_25211/g.40466 Transcript_25211/m.40466 type:complete len:231 (-) Transcript_25211:76-768(-)
MISQNKLACTINILGYRDLSVEVAFQAGDFALDRGLSFATIATTPALMRVQLTFALYDCRVQIRAPSDHASKILVTLQEAVCVLTGAGRRRGLGCSVMSVVRRFFLVRWLLLLRIHRADGGFVGLAPCCILNVARNRTPSRDFLLPLASETQSMRGGGSTAAVPGSISNGTCGNLQLRWSAPRENRCIIICLRGGAQAKRDAIASAANLLGGVLRSPTKHLIQNGSLLVP